MIIAEVEAAEAAEKDVEVGWQTRARISALRSSGPIRLRAMRRAKRAPGPGNFSRISMQPFLPTPSAHSVSLAQQPLRSPGEPSSSSADADADAAIELAHMGSARRCSVPDGEARVVTSAHTIPEDHDGSPFICWFMAAGSTVLAHAHGLF